MTSEECSANNRLVAARARYDGAAQLARRLVETIRSKATTKAQVTSSNSPEVVRLVTFLLDYGEPEGFK